MNHWPTVFSYPSAGKSPPPRIGDLAPGVCVRRLLLPGAGGSPVLAVAQDRGEIQPVVIVCPVRREVNIATAALHPIPRGIEPDEAMPEQIRIGVACVGEGEHCFELVAAIVVGLNLGSADV